MPAYFILVMEIEQIFFFCGGNLFDWEPTDITLCEHLRHFPNCALAQSPWNYRPSAFGKKFCSFCNWSLTVQNQVTLHRNWILSKKWHRRDILKNWSRTKYQKGQTVERKLLVISSCCVYLNCKLIRRAHEFIKIEWLFAWRASSWQNTVTAKKPRKCPYLVWRAGRRGYLPVPHLLFMKASQVLLRNVERNLMLIKWLNKTLLWRPESYWLNNS